MSKRFYREDSMRHIRLGSRKKKRSWRAPRGNQSKMRRKRKSYPAVVSIGYRTPKTERKTNPASISSPRELLSIKKGAAVQIASRVGAKKRLEIIKVAKEKEIILTNVREVQK